MQQPEDELKKQSEAKNKARKAILRRARSGVDPTIADDCNTSGSESIERSESPEARVASIYRALQKPIPPHEQLVKHDRIPVHSPCKRCGTDLYGLPTEYTEYAAVVVNWPEAWCPHCWLPQYVDLGESTRYLGDMPPYDSTAFLKRLKHLLRQGRLPADQLTKYTALQIHSPCKNCQYDLYGLACEYRLYSGIIIDIPQVQCPECGLEQSIHVSLEDWMPDRNAVKAVVERIVESG